jgi:putative two-component system response regulator
VTAAPPRPTALGPAVATGTTEGDRAVLVLAVIGGAPDLAVLASVAAAHRFDLRALATADELVTEGARRQPDAIVIDAEHPELDAYTLCAALKDTPATATIPIVLVTSSDVEEARWRALRVGCDEVLERPIDRQLLAFRIASFAYLRRAWATTRSSDNVLEALRRFALARDRADGRSERRLARACREFGRYLGLAEPELRALELAAALHDIGEIGIPPSILLKRGPLSPSEVEVMKRHTEIGAALLEPLANTQLLVSIVRHHHEQWSGRGYPDRLAGEAIPLLARVFRLLDVYDAVTQDRPYQRAYDLVEAIDIVAQDARDGGADPRLFEQFRTWLAAGGSAAWTTEPG